MLEKLRPRSVYDVMAALACFGVLAGGTAYAANTIGSTDIIDGEVKTPDLAAAGVTNSKLAPNSIGPSKIRTGAVGVSEITTGAVRALEVADNTLTGADLRDDSVTGADLALNAIGDRELAPAEDWHDVLVSEYDPGNPQPGYFIWSFTGRHANVGGGLHSAGYFRDHSGIVHLKGAVRCDYEENPDLSPMNDWCGAGVFVLPEGYRPSATEVFAIWAHYAVVVSDEEWHWEDRTGAIKLVVGPDGIIRHEANGTAQNLSLDGVTFRAAGF